jgi:hypothetical protein
VRLIRTEPREEKTAACLIFQRFVLLAGLTSAISHFIGDHTMFHVPAHKNTQNPPHQFTPK